MRNWSNIITTGIQLTNIRNLELTEDQNLICGKNRTVCTKKVDVTHDFTLCGSTAVSMIQPIYLNAIVLPESLEMTHNPTSSVRI